jgi:multidrug efflux system membrane fusion protein
VVINQVQPIFVAFSVPEQHLEEITKYMATDRVKVEVFIGTEEARPEEGLLSFVDNSVDIATGTIRLKATFPNREKRLWPGQFVNVVVTLTSQKDAIVIPSAAVQTGQKGQFIFVIKSDLTVESRPVTVSRTFNNESIIEKGLQAGENVVTDGQLRLVPGAKVEIKNGNRAGTT